MLVIKHVIFCTVLILFSFSAHTKNNGMHDLLRLKQAYPDAIQTVTKKSITWKDGSVMPVSDRKKRKTPEQLLDNPSVADQMIGVYYMPGVPADPEDYQPVGDPGRIRNEAFFKKMYGDSEDVVRANLVEIDWMPKIFGKQYPLFVTTVNGVDHVFEALSSDLEALVLEHPEYKVFLKNPGGTFQWRMIANTSRLSAHSFGMTLDINVDKSDYWQWDLQKIGLPIDEDMVLGYRNRIPWDIVEVFEKHGFIWGGKWTHYDTMHFEYRPELFKRKTSSRRDDSWQHKMI
jgi:peptidoglycan LD-endopeptidase CwlK